MCLICLMGRQFSHKCIYVHLPRNEAKNTSSVEAVLVTNENLTGRYDQVIKQLMTDRGRAEIKLDQ